MNRSQSFTKLNPADFLRKYNNQVMLWENRVRSGSSRPAAAKESREREEEAVFTPKINPRSKQLAKDIERIENRVQKLQEEKKKKIDKMQQISQPSFHPTINPVSEMIALENRRSLMEGS